MQALTNQLAALGWSLLDSIWQMALLWMVYYMLTVRNKRFSAAGKYNLALVFIFIGTEWFIYTLILVSNEPALSYTPGIFPVASSANQLTALFSLVYLLILALRFMQQGIQYVHLKNNISGRSTSPVLQAFADRYTRLLGITKKVHVYLSDFAETAETSGFLKPVILLPFSLVTRLTPQQLEAILIHELFHIRRNDYLINIFLNIFRAIFFFNPFSQLFCNALAKERELACDDGVIEMNYPPELYAEALYNLEKLRGIKSGLSIAVDGNKPWLLVERISRVLGNPVQHKNRISPLLIFSLCTALVLFGLKQETGSSNENVPVAVKPVPVFASRFESGQIEIKEKKIQVNISAHQKKVYHIVKAAKKPGQIADPEAVESAEPAYQAVFADNNIIRNFSNEQAAGLNSDPIQTLPGTPYVPSASLSYEDLPDNLIREDSIRDILIQNGIKDLVLKARIQIRNSLQQTQKEMETGQKQLKDMEIKNRKLIRLKQGNLKPVMEQIHREIKLKKKEIRQLQSQLQLSGEEIIHI